jgi:K+-transporting ATPase ATPase C chain
MKWLRVITVFTGLSLITGVLYPLAVTFVGQLLFAQCAKGSLIVAGKKLVGSELIGQQFNDPGYFWGRPTATGLFSYNPLAGAGSNLAQTNPALTSRVTSDVERILSAHQGKKPVPVDLLTASGSGLDPHVSVAAAEYQVDRVARARGVSEAEIGTEVRRFTEERTFGLLGERRVNVVLLNLSLDRSFPR